MTAGALTISAVGVGFGQPAVVLTAALGIVRLVSPLCDTDGPAIARRLGASVPAVLARTSSRYAVRLARQLGGEKTLRVELVRTVSTVTAHVTGGAVSDLLSQTVTGGEPPFSLALLLVAVVAFTVALRG